MRRLDPTPKLARATRPLLVALALLLTAGCRARLPLATHAPTAVPRAATRADLSHDVTRLRSDDFVTRARASERLVAAGESALPVLGAAGEGTVRVFGNQEVGTTAPVLRAILADVELERLVRHLDAPWPVVRRETAGELGRRGRWYAVPYLLPRLDDPDTGVRAASASSLRRLTNRFFGYDAKASLRARQRATERWRDWWSIEGRVRAAEDADEDAGAG